MNEKEIVNKFSKSQDSLVVQQSDFSLATISNMVVNDSIDVAPHYQRRDRWSDAKQSALIESFLLNVPVPPVYLSEDDYGSYSVIDGKQRITAINDFLTGNLRLKELKEFPQLNGKTFQDLPKQLKNVLSVRPFIRVITLLKQSDPELKYEVFLRLNTGGESLKRQEIRNVAYAGPLNDLLLRLSENARLREKLKINSEKSTAFRNMDDVEHVLRFFTIKNGWQGMGGVLADEMDKFMSEHQYDHVDDLRIEFDVAIERCFQFWGENAFYKPVNGSWRTQLISPLYDAEMVASSLLNDRQAAELATRTHDVVNATVRLYEEDSDFVKSVSQSTNNPASINRRVSAIHGMLVGLLR